MAVKTITPVKMEQNILSAAIVKEAPTAASDGFAIPYTDQDSKIVLLLDGGTAGGTITVKKGNGLQGVADTEAFSLAANEERAIVLESGKFKNIAGGGKGTVIVVPSAATIKLGAVVLP